MGRSYGAEYQCARRSACRAAKWHGDRTHGRSPYVSGSSQVDQWRSELQRPVHDRDHRGASSSNGTVWSEVVRIPIDGTTSTVDHFIPGLAVDKATAGSSAHLGLTYYYYPRASCSTSTCQLDVGFISSTNGGASWSAPIQLAGPMSLAWLASTNQGVMVGDYISTSFAGGTAHPVFALANAPSGSILDEAIYTTTAGLVPSGGSATSRGEPAVVSAGGGQVATPASVTVR
jgi:hypothetical protein